MHFQKKGLDDMMCQNGHVAKCSFKARMCQYVPATKGDIDGFRSGGVRVAGGQRAEVTSQQKMSQIDGISWGLQVAGRPK